MKSSLFSGKSAKVIARYEKRETIQQGADRRFHVGILHWCVVCSLFDDVAGVEMRRLFLALSMIFFGIAVLALVMFFKEQIDAAWKPEPKIRHGIGSWIKITAYENDGAKGFYLVDEMHAICFFVYEGQRATAGITVVPCLPLVETIKRLQAEQRSGGT